MTSTIIPASFASVADLLQIMIEIAEAFRDFNLDKWPHYKNKEDYDHIFKQPSPIENPLDLLYCDGRQFAADFSAYLTSFAAIDQAPTLSKYVDLVETGLTSQIPVMEKRLKNAKIAIAELNSHTFAVSEMTGLLEQQIQLAKVALDNCAILKRSTKYLMEQGKLRPGEQPRRLWERPIVIALSATLLAGLLAVVNTYLASRVTVEPSLASASVVCEQPPSSNSPNSPVPSPLPHQFQIPWPVPTNP